MFEIASVVLLISCSILLWRVFLGPTLYDRVIALNSFGTVSVLLIGILGFLAERPEFLDIAILYALINFIGTIAILKFFRYKMIDYKSDQKIESLMKND
jgi:multicomponent Na+:H+ antiporter subunit F